MKILFIFPVTIFEDIPFAYYDKIIILEEPRYFTDFAFHKMKLVFHRASLKNYAEYIKSKCKIPIIYANFYDINASFYKKYTNHECYGYDCYDFPLETKINNALPNFIWHDSKNFLMSRKELIENKYKRQGAFYKSRREISKLLMSDNGTPYGGKYSFDDENRKKLESSQSFLAEDEIYYDEKNAINYINKHFPNNYGDCDICYYPTTFADAKHELRTFIRERLLNFTFQDAIIADNSSFPIARLYHSCISAPLNIGLITDQLILTELKDVFALLRKKFNNKSVKDAKKSSHFKLLCSTEGFLRQIIGWRHYMLGIYLREQNLRNSNFMGYTKKINFDKWWTGIGILPIDNCIEKIRKYAYAHHIERLMILGNFMFMKGYRPKDVYEIFMCWTIDAYDWVMVSNIFTMSQFASSTSYTTKPYYSSSKYILRMSDYKKGEWCEQWDEVYREFLQNNAFVKKYNRF
jgi:deoxyribodipyrimidine photolyase-related protein